MIQEVDSDLHVARLGKEISSISFSMSGFVSHVKLCVDYVRNKHSLSKISMQHYHAFENDEDWKSSITQTILQAHVD